MTTDLLLIRINCPSRELALSIAEKAVAGRLAACANIEGPIASVYQWQGAIERAEEWLLWLKAPEANWAGIEALVQDIHPHDVPALLAVPCIRAHQRYADWLSSETKT